MNINMEENKYIYIKKSIPGHYIDFNEEIDKDYWEGQIGKNYDDFLNDKWVLLNEDQVYFHNKYPQASISEVLKLKLYEEPVIEETLEDVKRNKLIELDIYDKSENVDSFTINNTISTWFTLIERSNYKNSIESAKILGINELSLFINDELISFPVDLAEKVLASIQLYADYCSIVTQQHKKAINNLETIEEVNSYDYTVGYPEKLNFELTN